MEQESVNPEEEEHPERPLECSECKRPITVHYTEIIGNSITHIGMCSECPQLRKRLHGSPQETIIDTSGKITTGLVCGECGTTLADIQVGHAVGCPLCYEVFGDVLIDEMLSSQKISPKVANKGKSVPLHVGRSPGELHEISPTLKLIALNEALEETLKREDYEQAALLRDQIRELTEGQEKSDDQK